MNRKELLELYFLDARHKLIDVAACLDRIDRAQGEEDFRLEALHCALEELRRHGPDRAKRVLEVLSDPTDQPVAHAGAKGAVGAWPGEHRS